MRTYFLILLLATANTLAFAQGGIDHKTLKQELDRLEMELLYFFIQGNDELTKEGKPPEYLQAVNNGYAFLSMLRDNDWADLEISAVRKELRINYKWKKTSDAIQNWVDDIRNKSSKAKDEKELRALLNEKIHGNKSDGSPYFKFYDKIDKDNSEQFDELINRIVSISTIEVQTTEGNSNKQSEETEGDERSGLESAIQRLQDENNKLNSQIKSLKKTSSGVSFYRLSISSIIVFLFGLLIGKFMFGRSRKTKKKVKESSRANGSSDVYDKQSEQATKTAGKHRNEIKNLEDTIQNLKSKNKELDEENKSFRAELEAQKSEILASAERAPETKAEEQRKVVYLSSPSEDGTFSRTYETPTIGNLSFFEFQLTSENAAEFRFIEDPSIQKRALDTFSDRIAAVADEEHWAEANSRAIVTENSGLAKIDGDVWKVVKKAKVRYI